MIIILLILILLLLLGVQVLGQILKDEYNQLRLQRSFLRYCLILYYNVVHFSFFFLLARIVVVNTFIINIVVIVRGYRWTSSVMLRVVKKCYLMEQYECQKNLLMEKRKNDVEERRNENRQLMTQQQVDKMCLIF